MAQRNRRKTPGAFSCWTHELMFSSEASQAGVLSPQGAAGLVSVQVGLGRGFGADSSPTDPTYGL